LITKGTRALVFATAASGLFLTAAPAFAQQSITVWFSKGFYKSEDESLLAAIKKFEDKTKIKVELSQYAIQDMIPKTVAALDSGTPPDVAYADTYDVQASGKWAFEGKLEDITDILKPMMDKFAPNTVETAYLMNGQTKKKAYYGFPLKQQSMHVEIWSDCSSRPATRSAIFPRTGRAIGRSGAIRSSRPIARRQAAVLRCRPADGRGVHGLAAVVLHLHGRL
jgi:multiple sugar transport system substrate-binding protein